jgi:hypothetical protein
VTWPAPTTKRLLTAAICTVVVGLVLAPHAGRAIPGGREAPRKRVAPDLEVVEAVLGYVDPQTGDIVEATVIDTSKHKGFGWRIKFDGIPRAVRFREEFALPAPAQKWQVGPETTVAPDRASAVTEGMRHLDAKMTLRNAWIHTPGDPKGWHTTRVWVQDTLVAEFRYRLR